MKVPLLKMYACDALKIKPLNSLYMYEKVLKNNIFITFSEMCQSDLKILGFFFFSWRETEREIETERQRQTEGMGAGAGDKILSRIIESFMIYT